MKFLSVTASFLPSSTGGHWHPRLVNGEELLRWREGPGLHAFVEALRTEGWSLVSSNPASPSEGVNTYRFAFQIFEIDKSETDLAVSTHP